MGIFASETTATVPLPFDPPETITIQKLTGADVERAQAAHLSATVAGKTPRGWEQLFKNAVAKGIATDADAARMLNDPLAGYDRITIVRAGLKAWSYKRAVDAAAIDDIDDESLEFIATEIMRLTKPALFQTPEEREAAKKKG
jgi:hypothetical protein